MKTPLELIKHGILNEKWSYVIEGYKILTGEDLSKTLQDEKLISVLDNAEIGEWNEIPNFTVPSNEAITSIKSEIPIIQNTQEFITSTKVSESNNKRKHPKISELQLGPRHNKFFDDKTLERQDLKVNNPQLQKLYTNNFVERERKEATMVGVQCNSCGNSILVPPALAPIHFDGTSTTFHCNKCLEGKISGRSQ